MRVPVLLLVLLTTVASFAAEKFEGTYYLSSRDRVTWVLVLSRESVCEIYGPDGQFAAGTYKASDDHLTIAVGQQRRQFNYDKEKGHAIKLGYRDNTRVEKGGPLAKLPPSKESQDREVYIREKEWLESGKPALAKRLPAGGPIQPGDGGPGPGPGPAPAPGPGVGAAPAPVGAGGAFDDIAGSYYLPGPNNQREQFSVSPDGHYEYLGLDGAKSQGTATRNGDELILVGPAHRRSFSAHKIPGGIELIRKEQDVIKLGDPLGKMPPQEREPFTWFKVSSAEPLSAPQAPAAVNVVPAALPAAAGPNIEVTFNALLGSYVHKPNPFISETITIGSDGTFRYKDSNGASAAGVFSLVDDTLTITSGEVVRRFRVTMDSKFLTLNCAPNDTPKLKNDMASMSPTVLKVAKYQKQ